jgi:hypothetical protein
VHSFWLSHKENRACLRPSMEGTALAELKLHGWPWELVRRGKGRGRGGAVGGMTRGAMGGGLVGGARCGLSRSVSAAACCS